MSQDKFEADGCVVVFERKVFLMTTPPRPAGEFKIVGDIVGLTAVGEWKHR